ncbi:hypothetical protein [Pseudomonas peli]|uniref:hypothetical protein n=1 Tax=Pseudomonas peli TaxID=592361 RepID=UPI0024AE2736|nr:hypothetical protein [Pseudomonas peli]
MKLLAVGAGGPAVMTARDIAPAFRRRLEGALGLAKWLHQVVQGAHAETLKKSSNWRMRFSQVGISSHP